MDHVDPPAGVSSWNFVARQLHVGRHFDLCDPFWKNHPLTVFFGVWPRGGLLDKLIQQSILKQPPELLEQVSALASVVPWRVMVSAELTNAGFGGVQLNQPGLREHARMLDGVVEKGQGVPELLHDLNRFVRGRWGVKALESPPSFLLTPLSAEALPDS